jgi:GTP diphosphokinase / guanosine-3',5'-bis(diphosphate) 3'-diphosphatase
MSYNLSAQEEKKLILREYKSLLAALKPRMDNEERKLVRLAFEIASEAHKSTRRKSGEPYILHPIAVAKIAAEEIGLGVRSSIASLLHDTVEDTDLTIEDIKSNFGNEIARIIEGLTKISYVEENANTTQQAENFRKVLRTLLDDARIVLIKLADRLHNMRTMEHMKRDKQLKISSETTFLYAPLAHRLGMYSIHSELMDLSLKYTEPEVYAEIEAKLADTASVRDKLIKEFIKPIKQELDTLGIKAEIYGRVKSISSIVNKIRTKYVQFEEIFDIFAIRIIIDAPEGVDDKNECWRAYGAVGKIYRAGVNRMRDWISVPKGNGYEALHNTFLSPDGKWVEVQIKSTRMNEVAEKGIAAHWKYKEEFKKEEQALQQDQNLTANERKKKTRILADEEKRVHTKLDDFMKQMKEMLATDSTVGSLEFINDIKAELFRKEIYVYTPKGDIRVLPEGSTALDFAFDVHSELGAKCLGAKVNYKLVPISYVLSNGDQIEIIVGKNQKPHDDWLKFVKTGKAKGRIRYYLREEKRVIGEQGEITLLKKMNANGLPATSENISIIASYYKLASPLDLYVAIAENTLNLSDLKEFRIKGGVIYHEQEIKTNVKEIKDQIDLSKQLPDKGFELILFGESSNKIKYKLASCCSPISGDDVFGFITSGDGLKIHRTNCPNAASLMANYAHRVVRAKWAGSKQLSFLTAVRIVGLDDVGVINKITTVISGDLKVNMRSMNIESKDGIFEGTFTVFVQSKEQLEQLCARLGELEGINKVIRLQSDED